MSKDETWKKKSVTQKDLKKYIIKIMRVKIEIKKYIRRQARNFNWMVKLKWKITLT
jgi:uncharacterized protein (UPF0335 family)